MLFTSLFSIAAFLPCLESVLEGKGSRITPSPYHLHTLREERTRRRKAMSLEP